MVRCRRSTRAAQTCLIRQAVLTSVPAVTGIDETNDPSLASWVAGAGQGSDFPIQNLPLGIFSVGERRRRACVAIGDFVLDLTGIADLLDDDWIDDLSQPVLNAWLSRGPAPQQALRRRLV